jgi:hypothetical protein
MRVYQQGDASIAFGIQKKLEAFLLAHLTYKKSLKKIRIEKIMSFQNKRVKISKK